MPEHDLSYAKRLRSAFAREHRNSLTRVPPDGIDWGAAYRDVDAMIRTLEKANREAADSPAPLNPE
jgi:hypothetical protein